MAANKRRIWQQRLRAFGGGLERPVFHTSMPERGIPTWGNSRTLLRLQNREESGDFSKAARVKIVTPDRNDLSP